MLKYNYPPYKASFAISLIIHTLILLAFVLLHTSTPLKENQDFLEVSLVTLEGSSPIEEQPLAKPAGAEVGVEPKQGIPKPPQKKVVDTREEKLESQVEEEKAVLQPVTSKVSESEIPEEIEKKPGKEEQVSSSAEPKEEIVKESEAKPLVKTVAKAKESQVIPQPPPKEKAKEEASVSIKPETEPIPEKKIEEISPEKETKETEEKVKSPEEITQKIALKPDEAYTSPIKEEVRKGEESKPALEELGEEEISSSPEEKEIESYRTKEPNDKIVEKVEANKEKPALDINKIESLKAEGEVTEETPQKELSEELFTDIDFSQEKEGLTISDKVAKFIPSSRMEVNPEGFSKDHPPLSSAQEEINDIGDIASRTVEEKGKKEGIVEQAPSGRIDKGKITDERGGPFEKGTVQGALDRWQKLGPAAGRKRLAVMIDNSPDALPQSGLPQADIIYEMPVEGGFTRLMPIYGEEDIGIVGPIRSARDYFIEKAQEHKAIYIHAGGSPQSLAVLKSGVVEDIDEFENKDAFWRSTHREAPHNLYASTESLREKAMDRGFDSMVILEESQFDEEAQLKSTKVASSVSITYSKDYRVIYLYSPSSDSYYRHVNGKPHIDAESKKQLTTKTVIVQFVKTEVIDSEGRLRLALVGEGNGFVFSQGKVIRIRWIKKSKEERTIFVGGDGKSIKLPPGKLWIEVVPNGRNVKY